MVAITKSDNITPRNFEEFLRTRFGETLYKLYFKPYNEKVWRCDLKEVPLDWLEGKLPMPTVQEMIYNNIHHIKEKSFVHSSFYYEKQGGSQFLADRLAEDLDVRYSTNIQSIERNEKQWLVDGIMYDKVIFCGNIKELPQILRGG